MDLYGLIHQRYILTNRPIPERIREKLGQGHNDKGEYFCPTCGNSIEDVVPIAMSEELSVSRVKIFCPKCEDVYIPTSKFVDIDGAYFGKSFPIIFFQTFPELVPDEAKKSFVPKIYGFKIFGMTGSKYENKTLPNAKGMKDKNQNKNKYKKDNS